MQSNRFAGQFCPRKRGLRWRRHNNATRPPLPPHPKGGNVRGFASWFLARVREYAGPTNVSFATARGIKGPPRITRATTLPQLIDEQMVAKGAKAIPVATLSHFGDRLGTAQRWMALPERVRGVKRRSYFFVGMWAIDYRATRRKRPVDAGFCEIPRFEGFSSKNGCCQKNDRPGSLITHAERSVRLRTRPPRGRIRSVWRLG